MGDIDDATKINGVLAAALAWREIDRDHAGDAPELRRYLLSQYEQRLREAVDRWADMVPAFAWPGMGTMGG